MNVAIVDLIKLVVKLSFTGFATYMASKQCLRLMNSTDPQTRKNVREILNSLGVDKNLELNDHELSIAAQVVNPANLDVKFESIAGLDDIIDVIRTDIIKLLTNPSLRKRSPFYRPPKGILLHGPPGCGKTTIAQAIAKESNARFVDLNISSLSSKWYGESNKFTDAVFSLAIKISPCIIFIDEIDSFLRNRQQTDHEATAMMKAIFLKKWDEVAKNPKHPVILIGATNRKLDIDEAILSRMESQFEIKLPNYNQRIEIFKKMLQSTPLDHDVKINQLAYVTDGFSGRNIEDVCKDSSMIALREYLKNQDTNHIDSSSSDENSIRLVNLSDFMIAINRKKCNIDRYIGQPLD